MIKRNKDVSKKMEKEITKYWKINMIENRPVGHSLETSLERISITVGEQITAEQLTELSIVMRISRYDHVYRHHVRDK